MTVEAASLAFPDEPRSRLDRALTELVETAQEVLTTQGRLRSLLNATRAVSGEIELPAVLRRIIEAAVELVGARYGAICVIGPDGSREEVIHAGAPDPAHHGDLPQGHGVLEVPIRVRGEIYGTISLAEDSAGAFTDDDRELLTALAGAAGAAIDHARLFDESRRRQEWSAASADVTAALLSEQSDDSLAMLADRVASLAAADLVCVAVPLTGDTMIVRAYRGPLASVHAEITLEPAGTLVARALESGQPVLSDAVIDGLYPGLSVGPSMAVPLTSSDDPTGVLVVSRLPGTPRFTTADLDMAAEFATQASLAIRIAQGRAARQRLALLEDRERIARDLHDHVIQHLFGVGLRLQAIAGTIQDSHGRGAIIEQVKSLDATIAEIRTAIFTLTTDPDAEKASVRHQMIDLLGEMAQILEEPPRVSFVGAVDLMVPPTVVDDLLAVVREGLANIARHANASVTAVSISVDRGTLTVIIEDDGDGITTGQRHAHGGTSNLRDRATRRGGSLHIVPREPRGTTLNWTVPIPEGTESA